MGVGLTPNPSLVGPAGAIGPTGPTGAASTVTGPTGPDGATGATGAAGATGPTGAAGTVIPSFYINDGNTSTYGMPGVIINTEATAQSLAANYVYYCPFYVAKAITITEMSANCTTASSTSGAEIRFAIYQCNEFDWMPDSLVVDAGTASVTSTGQKSITSMSTTLQPGYYAARLQGDASASRPSFYTWRGSPITGTTLGSATQIHFRIYKTGVTWAAADNPPGAPVADGTSASPFLYWIRMKWTQA